MSRATALVWLGVAACVAGCGGAPARSADAGAAARATQPPREHRPRLGSIAAALRYIRGQVGVPVPVPANLPPGTLPFPVRPVAAGGGVARLTLLVPGSGPPRRRALTIEYGDAGFDGCGPLHPRAVRIGRRPGVLEFEHGYGTVVWPATLHERRGRYGLSGEFPVRRLLAFARAMAPSSAQAARRATGC